MTPPPDHLRRAAAQKYARHGWSVFPVTPNQKDPPLVPWRSFETRRPRRDQVVRMFRQFPTANIGVICGAVSGLTVLDIDIKPWESKRGDLTLATLLEEHGPLPHTPRQRTWSGAFKSSSSTPRANGTARCESGMGSMSGATVATPCSRRATS